MRKILIVDDNLNNRILLRAVLEEFAEENETVECVIDEATNGIEAVQQSADVAYDLILMDIMMPEMDGIEATKRIRAMDPKVMIVAVSAVDDTARQKEILRNGAEDYISKPVNVDILNARLGNYFALIESRRNKVPDREEHNPFSRQIYSRKLFFFIETEDDLAEFWEYYLLKTQNGCALLSDTVRTFYAIGSIGLKFNLKLPIWVEESDDYVYFTIEGLETLDSKFIRLVLAKTPSLSDYKLETEKFSVRVSSSLMEQNRFVPAEKTEPAAPLAEPAVAQPSSVPPVQPAVQISVTDERENRTYDYMDDEDLGDIKDYLSRLNSLLLMVGSGDINADEVDEIAVYLDRIGKVASIYSESYTIGRALSALSTDIRGNLQGFIEKSTSLGPLCGAFGRDLMSWIRLIFDEGAPSVNYMDDTIVSNAQMISSMLTMDETAGAEGDLDDIFDF